MYVMFVCVHIRNMHTTTCVHAFFGVYECVCVCLCARIGVCVFACVYVRASYHIKSFVNPSIHESRQIYIHIMSIYDFTHVYVRTQIMYIHTCIRIHMSIYVYSYVYVSTYTSLHTLLHPYSNKSSDIQIHQPPSNKSPH